MRTRITGWYNRGGFSCLHQRSRARAWLLTFGLFCSFRPDRNLAHLCFGVNHLNKKEPGSAVAVRLRCSAAAGDAWLGEWNQDLEDDKATADYGRLAILLLAGAWVNWPLLRFPCRRLTGLLVSVWPGCGRAGLLPEYFFAMPLSGPLRGLKTTRIDSSAPPGRRTSVRGCNLGLQGRFFGGYGR